ncbi:MAG: response regulator [Candidatus Omnitrophica bacterium]|nr:response regulator [Candidatus Omnitrophota bacterium]
MPQKRLKRLSAPKRRTRPLSRTRPALKVQRTPRFRILVCDDEPKICHIVTELVAGLAYADTASNGVDALHKLKTHHHDLLVLDLKMPRMDGLAVLDALRQSQRELRVIILTAHQDLAVAHQVYRTYKILAYFTKPFDIHELRATIEQALRHAPQPV